MGKNRNWTIQEHEFLCDNYLTMEYGEIAKILGRTKGAVRNRCYHFGLEKHRSWTAAEIETLRQCYNHAADGAIDLDAVVKSKFPNRHKTVICGKAKQLGLTNQRRQKAEQAIIKTSIAKREWHRLNDHPRGFLGHRHTEDVRRVIGARSRASWQDLQSGLNSDERSQLVSDRMHREYMTGQRRSITYSRCSGGRRQDLDGRYMRSSWEANYARYLEWLISIGEIDAWEYEPDIFEFAEIKRGVRSFTPDFKVYNLDGTIEYHEIKGWMDNKSQTKIRRMKQFYPHIILKVIDEDAYKALARDVKHMISNWE